MAETTEITVKTSEVHVRSDGLLTVTRNGSKISAYYMDGSLIEVDFEDQESAKAVMAIIWKHWPDHNDSESVFRMDVHAFTVTTWKGD